MCLRVLHFNVLSPLIQQKHKWVTLALKPCIEESSPRHRFGPRCGMDQVDGKLQVDSNANSISQHTLCKDFGSNLLRIEEVPRMGNIWVPHCVNSLNHFTHIFIPSVEILFQARDKNFKIEAIGQSSRLLCWRLCQDARLICKMQLDSLDEQIFAFTPIVFQDVIPIVEGK